MPTIDHQRDVLVVRIVYDGPPFSGKTTTLRTLAGGLGVAVTTPEECDGRTLFFDWVEYVGGLFDGRQIRCQIITVPGQPALAARRARLLDEADAVIFVADTRETHVPTAMEHLGELMARCRSEEPPVGVVLQANKRDASDSVPLETLRTKVNSVAPVAIVETVATAGEGVREAFVFAVRLALDRVRALLSAGRLAEGTPSINNAAQLLAELTELEAAPLESMPAPSATVPELSAFDEQIQQLSPHRVFREREPVVVGVEEQPFAPDPMMPGGFIWPPVDGRTYLHEVSGLGLQPVCTMRGDWWMSGQGWRFHSVGRAVYENAEVGRQALIDWARLHAGAGRWLSQGRSVILADAGRGRFRLWQLVRVEQSLRERLANAAAEQSASRLAYALGASATHLLDARKSLSTAGVRLPCTLWTMSVDAHLRPVFTGLMPEVDDPVGDELEGARLIEREFAPIVHSLSEERSDYADVVSCLERQSGAGTTHSALAALARVRYSMQREGVAAAGTGSG